MDEQSLLLSRITDLYRTYAKRGFAQSDFLTENEQTRALAFLKKLSREHSFLYAFDGGCEGCARKTIVIYDEKNGGEVVFLFVRRKDRGKIEHRALLGSILGLGVERGKVGDLFAYEDGMAAAVKKKIAPYLLEELKKVGKDAVEVHPLALPDDFSVERKTEDIYINLPQLRLDCVIGELCRFSRDKASAYIAAGNAQIDHEVCLRPDKKLKGGETLSLRSFGRYTITQDVSLTKSGRMRVRVEKAV